MNGHSNAESTPKMRLLPNYTYRHERALVSLCSWNDELPNVGCATCRCSFGCARRNKLTLDCFTIGIASPFRLHAPAFGQTTCSRARKPTKYVIMTLIIMNQSRLFTGLMGSFWFLDHGRGGRLCVRLGRTERRTVLLADLMTKDAFCGVCVCMCVCGIEYSPVLATKKRWKRNDHYGDVMSRRWGGPRARWYRRWSVFLPCSITIDHPH